MAWLKIETHTPDKPEVFAIASALGIDPDAVFGKCFRVWVWFDAHTTNGKTNGVAVSSALIDRVAGVSGFAEAMKSADWLTFNGEGYEVPNFDRHNGETAKQRALTAKRVSKHSKKTNAEPNATNVSEALPREEKIREEESTPLADKSAQKRRTRIPADFYPNEVGVTKAEKAGVNIAIELQKFSDYHQAKGTTMLDWQAAWRTWISNAKQFGRSPNANHRNTNADTIAAFTGQRQPAVSEGGSGFVVEGSGTRV